MSETWYWLFSLENLLTQRVANERWQFQNKSQRTTETKKPSNEGKEVTKSRMAKLKTQEQDLGRFPADLYHSKFFLPSNRESQQHQQINEKKGNEIKVPNSLLSRQEKN